MKKRVLYSLLTSLAVFSTAAYAEDASTSALTTKGYVDTGLKYVYDAIRGDVTNVEGDITDLQTDVGNLANTVGTAGTQGNPGTGLVGAIESLQDTIGDANGGLVKDVADNADAIEALETAVGDANGGLVKRVNDLESSSNVYTAGDGIAVTPGATSSDPSTIGLNINNVQNNTTYVYKTNGSGVGTWQAMEVEDSWNPEFLTTPANP